MSINWGIIDPNAYQRGAEMSQGIFDRMRDERIRGATGNALQALMADPNATPPSLNALAMLAPAEAAQLIKFQQGQQDRARDMQFRSALSDYYGAGGSGMNALAPTRPTAGPTNETPPPISAAPPPPADWQARLGNDGVAAIAASEKIGVPDSPIRPVLGGSALQPIDPSADLGGMTADPYASRGFGAESGVTGQMAPEGLPAADAPLPPEIERAANSPDMSVRNAAFRRMMQIDPVQAMKIQSEERDRTLDAMEDSVKAFRWASEALSNARDDASYKQILARVEQATAPLGIDLRSMVPGTHPGPDGIRQLQLQALDTAQRLAAIDRRFSAEARADDIEADNARQDRNTDNIIENRNVRTGIARDRAAIAGRRESRLTSGGGGGKRSGGPTVLKNGTIIEGKGPNAGKRFVYHNGELKPLRVSQ